MNANYQKTAVQRQLGVDQIAFILTQDVTEPRLPRAALIRAAGFAAPAFEIVDSAITDWKITLADTVADNASCGALVVGRDRTPVAQLNLRLAGMVLSVSIPMPNDSMSGRIGTD